MSTFQNIEEARAYFSGDRFATDNGMTLEELDDNHAVCKMVVSDGHKNANGGVMGGAIFTLGDLAFAALANNKHRPSVAQQVSVNFLNAPKSGVLTATAICKKEGRNSIVCNVDICDEDGREIAQFIATGYKLQKQSKT